MMNTAKDILGLFLHFSHINPDAVAVQDGDIELTYSDLDRKSYAVAVQLQILGVKKNDVIPLIAEPNQYMVIGLLGILRTGATYVPLDCLQWPTTTIENVISQIHPTVTLFTHRTFDLGSIAPSVSVEDLLEQPSRAAPVSPLSHVAAIEPEDLACVIFTSGTTGKSKGVMIRHSSILHFVTSPPFNYHVTTRDRVLLVLSVAFDGRMKSHHDVVEMLTVATACMGTLFSVICNGGCLVLANASTLQDRVQLCTVFVGTPSILEALRPPLSPSDYSQLNRIVLGGETPSAALLRQWKTATRAIWIAYGPTEATCATLTGQIVLSAGELSDPRMLGSAIDQAIVTIVDENLEPINSLDKEGELLISGPGLARGYWQDEKQTNEKFIIYGSRRTYRTGDYVKWVKDSRGKPTVYFCGRKDRLVKLQGFLVNLDSDLDMMIANKVPEARGVFSYVDRGKLYTAVWPQELDSASLFHRFEQIFPRYMLPAHIVALERFPQNSSGKLDVAELRNIIRICLEKVPSIDSDWFGSTPFWKIVLDGLYNVSGLSKSAINPHLSFIANGVHSLAAVRLSFYLQRFGFVRRPREILTAETIISFVEADQGARPTPRTNNALSLNRPLDSSKPTDLTAQQRRLLLGTLQCPHFNIVNHILECDLQYLGRLKTAWGLLSQVEPIFKTQIQISDDQYTQRVQESPILVWSERSIQPEELEKQLISTAAGVGFGSRFTIFRFRYTSQVAFVWSIHHALIDAFSASLVLEKLVQALNGQQIEPSPPFCEAVHAIQAAIELKEDESQTYWKEQEEKFPGAAADLPIRQPNEFDQILSHDDHIINLNRFQEGIAEFCSLQNVTSGAIHYAVWSLVLAAYTGSQDVCFGAILSGRDLECRRPDLLVGCLLDTLPLRSQIDRKMTVTEFVCEMHQSIQSISKFHGSIIQAFEGHYSTALSFEPGMPEWDVKRLGFPACSRVREYPSLPMSVMVRCDGQVCFLYRTSHYAKDDVITLGKIYEKILELLLSRNLTIREALQQKFSEEEANRVLALGNIYQRESYDNTDATTIASMLDDAASQFSSDTALKKGHMSLTYCQLHHYADQLALLLQSCICPGDTVCLFADRSLHWIVGVVAILKSSAVYCPIDVGLPQTDQQDVIRSSKCIIVLCNNTGQQRLVLDLGKRALHTAQILQLGQPKVCKSVRSTGKPGDPSFLVFTSGSTGRPKGILIEDRSLVAVLKSSKEYLGTKPGDRVAQFMSPGFDAATYEILLSLCSGAILVLRNEPNDPFSHVSDVDTIMMTPSIASNLDPTEFPNIRQVCLAGEPVPDRVVQLWDTDQRNVYNLYGPTEGTILTSIQHLTSGVTVHAGPPLRSMRVYILNDYRELLPSGVLGMIYIAGIQVSRGYINNEVKTRTEFHDDPYALSSKTGERMYCTGDLGYLDREGNIHCVGRRDRQIKLRGFRTDLDSLANSIIQVMPEIAKAFVTEQHGSLVLWLEPEKIDTERLRALFRERVSAHITIARIIPMKQLPLNNNGKIDSQKLNSYDFGNLSSQITTELLSPVEMAIADEWRSLVGLKATVMIKKSDTFLSHGGNSVLQLALAHCLKRKIGVRVSVKDIINAPALEELALLIEERKRAQLARQDTYEAQTQISPNGVGLVDTSTRMVSLGKSNLTPPELDWWARYQYGQQHSTFNVPFVATLSSEVDVNRLKSSIDLAIARHEVLKSRFIQKADEAPQRILSAEAITARIVQGEIDLKEFLNLPFNLTHDALVRVCLNSSLLAISISHILIDMTGLRCLLADVAAYYRQESAISPLPRTRQYFDVQQWSRRAAASKIAFWRSYLHNLPSYSKVAAAQRSYRGTSLLSHIPSDIYQRIQFRASEQNISLHQFVLSATALVLQSLNHCNDIMLGAPYINRPFEEDRDVIGLFLEPLPIRLGGFHARWSSDRILQEVRSSAQSALANVLPWPELMKHRGLSFPSDQHELFRSVVTLHDDRYTTVAVPIPGVKSQMVWVEGAKFPMCIEFHAGVEQLTMRIEYDLDAMNGTHAYVFQTLLFCALGGLLDTWQTYASLCEEINGVCNHACRLQGISMDEICKITRDHLL